MTDAEALKKLVMARDGMRHILQRLQQSEKAVYRPLINRGRSILNDLDFQIANIRRQSNNDTELGFAWFVPLAWAAGAAALAAASKWTSDVWTTSSRAKMAELETYERDVARVGPERAAQLQRERQVSSASWWQTLLTAVAVLGGLFLFGALR